MEVNQAYPYVRKRSVFDWGKVVGIRTGTSWPGTWTFMPHKPASVRGETVRLHQKGIVLPVTKFIGIRIVPRAVNLDKTLLI